MAVPRFVAVVVVTALAGSAPAVAADYDLGPPLDVSAGQDLAGCTAGASADFAFAYAGAEVEPQIAVNPLDPDEILGAAQQDRWPDGGARGLTSWFSADGAAPSWSQLPAVPLERMPGRHRQIRACHRSVGLLRRGGQRVLHRPADRLRCARHLRRLDHELRPRGRRLAAAADPHRGLGDPGASTTRSPSRATRRAPATRTRPGSEATTPTAGLPVRDRGLPLVAYRGLPMLSRTTDGGDTWSNAGPMRTPTPTSRATRSRCSRTGRCSTSPRCCSAAPASSRTARACSWPADAVQRRGADVVRAGTRWRRWERPPTVNPDDGSPLRVGDYLPDIAVDRDSGADVRRLVRRTAAAPLNHVVLVALDRRQATMGELAVPGRATRTWESFNHAVAVTATGSVAVPVLRHPRQHAGSPASRYGRVASRIREDGGRTFSARRPPLRPVRLSRWRRRKSAGHAVRSSGIHGPGADPRATTWSRSTPLPSPRATRTSSRSASPSSGHSGRREPARAPAPAPPPRRRTSAPSGSDRPHRLPH